MNIVSLFFFLFLDNGNFPLNLRSSQLQDQTGVTHLFEKASAFVIFTANIMKLVKDDETAVEIPSVLILKLF